MSASPVIKLTMGDGVVAASPHLLVAEGIGSCVVLTLYSPRLKIGGLAHIMLPGFATGVQRPESGAGRHEGTKISRQCQFAGTAIDFLLHELLAAGVVLENIEAKIAGGAKMFSASNEGYPLGRLTIESVKQVLATNKIRLDAWDIGGHHGRTIEFHLDSGRMVIRGIEKKDKEI